MQLDRINKIYQKRFPDHFVMFRVISWIVWFLKKGGDPRNHTNKPFSS